MTARLRANLRLFGRLLAETAVLLWRYPAEMVYATGLGVFGREEEAQAIIRRLQARER